jgi:hypothetical protein
MNRLNQPTISQFICLVPILILSFFVPQILPTPFVSPSVYVIISCYIVPSELWKHKFRHHHQNSRLFVSFVRQLFHSTRSQANANRFNNVLLSFPPYSKCGPGSSVGIATELRAGRSGIESRWGQDIPPVQTDPGAHSASCKMGTGSFPRVKCGRGVLLTTHPLLVPRSWKSRAIPVPTIWATPGL